MSPFDMNRAISCPRRANLGCEGIEGDGMSCLLEEGKSFIAKLITDEEFYLLVDAMIHESFA